jgi:hypothetical protein
MAASWLQQQLQQQLKAAEGLLDAVDRTVSAVGLAGGDAAPPHASASGVRSRGSRMHAAETCHRPQP